MSTQRKNEDYNQKYLKKMLLCPQCNSIFGDALVGILLEVMHDYNKLQQL